MTTHAIRRVLQTIPILFIISALFHHGAFRAGGAVNCRAQKPQHLERADRNIEEKLGLNDPLPVQYGRWMGAMFNGDMGVPTFRRPLRDDQ